MGVVCLHGFLGRGSDWDFLPFEHRAPDLFAAPIDASMAAWAREFEVGAEDALIGYSMGGRLALHLLLTRRLRRAVIVSAGLGLESGREERRAVDERWARRFEADPWDGVIRDWNAQPLFGGHELPRAEHDFDRSALAAALRLWSPAAQEPLAARLAQIETPVLWIAGERDEKYVREGERAVAALPDARLWICPGAGHRVPWEQPEAFLSALAQFGVAR